MPLAPQELRPPSTTRPITKSSSPIALPWAPILTHLYSKLSTTVKPNLYYSALNYLFNNPWATTPTTSEKPSKLQAEPGTATVPTPGKIKNNINGIKKTRPWNNRTTPPHLQTTLHPGSKNPATTPQANKPKAKAKTLTGKTLTITTHRSTTHTKAKAKAKTTPTTTNTLNNKAKTKTKAKAKANPKQPNTLLNNNSPGTTTSGVMEMAMAATTSETTHDNSPTTGIKTTTLNNTTTPTTTPTTSEAPTTTTKEAGEAKAGPPPHLHPHLHFTNHAAQCSETTSTALFAKKQSSSSSTSTTTSASHLRLFTGA
jgi:hypothetical protein